MKFSFISQIKSLIKELKLREPIIMKYLSELDIFGTPFYFNTPNGKTHYQSLIGGIATVAVLALSFVYLLYVILQWNLGYILPRVSSSLNTSPYQAFEIEGEVLRIAIEHQEGLVNPFSSTNNLITPLLIQVIDFKTQDAQPVFSEYVDESSGHQIIIRKVQLVQKSQEVENAKQNQFIFISFAPCVALYLKPGQSCAPQNEIDDYILKFAQVMKLAITVKQFDASTNTFSSIVKQSFMIFDNSIRLYTEITLQMTQQELDDGLLMSNRNYNNFVSDYRLFTQVVSKEYMRKYFGFDAIAALLFKLNDLRVEQRIAHIKITEILAQVGSMVSVLLSLRAVVEFMNNKLMKQEIVFLALKVKYPKLENLAIKRNILGKIIEVKENQTKYDLALFEHYYDQAEKRLWKNLTISNILGSLKAEAIKKTPNLEIDDVDEVQQSKVFPATLKSPPQDGIENLFCSNSRYD